MNRRPVLLAALAVAALLATGCAGNGTQVVDGRPCSDWTHGQGRDNYLRAHGLHEYDAGETGRRPYTIAVGRLITRLCKDNPNLLIDSALRRAARTADRGGEPPTRPPTTLTEPGAATSKGKRRRKVSGETKTTGAQRSSRSPSP